MFEGDALDNERFDPHTTSRVASSYGRHAAQRRAGSWRTEFTVVHFSTAPPTWFDAKGATK